MKINDFIIIFTKKHNLLGRFEILAQILHYLKSKDEKIIQEGYR